MAYKQKTCPRCGTVHTKRGQYCSRSCGNVREWNTEQKKAVSDGLKQWHATSDTAAVASHNFTSQGKNKEAEPVPPQVHTGPLHNQFVDGGDLWTIDE